MKRRVVVTGGGCISPLGADVETVWRRLTHGESGAGPITLFDASRFPVRIAAEAREWSPDLISPLPDFWTSLPRQTLFAVYAAERASESAGLSEELSGVSPGRVGVSLGCGEIFPDLGTLGTAVGEALMPEGLDGRKWIRAALRTWRAENELAMEPGTAEALVAGRMNAQGPGLNFTTACVSSTIALGEAAEVIRRGDADIMFAGGTHSMIHPLGISGFFRLATLSTRNEDPQGASRPFDRDRDGFLIGEGGAVLVLEELEAARRRGAEIWAELAGYGCTHDAYRLSDPLPDGRMAARCMELALRDAGKSPDQVDHINAHGSATQANDVAETAAIHRALGAHARRVSVSATKSMTGHLTTACGALEFLFCVMAIRRGVVPPTINLETPDPQCDLDFVPGQARRQKVRVALNNNFGFGGQNSVLVATRFEL